MIDLLADLLAFLACLTFILVVIELWPWDFMGRLKPGRKGTIFSREARARHPRFWRVGWRRRARRAVAAEEEALRREAEREERGGG